MPAGLRSYHILALLLIAQLCIAAHAAEHGPGQHSHEGVACLYGITNDDDGAVPPLFAPPQAAVVLRTVRLADPVSILPGSEALLPPATGPPVSS